MVFMQVWAKSKKQWRLTAIVGFVAWASDTVYIGYETEWNGSTSPTWFFIFGWAGVGCYFVAVILAIMADRNGSKMYDVNSIHAGTSLS